MYPSPHIRALAAMALLLVSLVGYAQRDSSLSRDFEKLSAKERARIAKEEQENAEKDGAYQSVMAEAETLFRQQQYEASMEKFKAARTMRPYNVYPKVKIQDLEALIARRDAEKPAEPAPVLGEPIVPVEPQVASKPSDPNVSTKPTPEPPVPASRLVVAPRDPSPVVPPLVPRKDPPAATPVRTVPAEKPPVPTARRIVEPSPGPGLEEGERIYKEGRSVVLERRVAVDGRIVVFKKVSHPWGEVHHFREAIAISAREFEEAAGK